MNPTKETQYVIPRKGKDARVLELDGDETEEEELEVESVVAPSRLTKTGKVNAGRVFGRFANQEAIDAASKEKVAKWIARSKQDKQNANKGAKTATNKE